MWNVGETCAFCLGLRSKNVKSTMNITTITKNTESMLICGFNIKTLVVSSTTTHRLFIHSLYLSCYSLNIIYYNKGMLNKRERAKVDVRVWV